MRSGVIEVNGFVLWGQVLATPDGFRLGLALADWQKLGVSPGQRVSLRLAGPEEWLFVTHVTERPPVAWVVLGTRLRLAA